MNERLLENSLEAFYGLREELQGKAEDSVMEMLDEAINDLELARQQNNNKINAIDVLKKLGSVVETISNIVTLIKLLGG